MGRKEALPHLVEACIVAAHEAVHHDDDAGNEQQGAQLAAVAGGMTFFRKSIWSLLRRLTGRDRQAATTASPEKDSKVS